LSCLRFDGEQLPDNDFAMNYMQKICLNRRAAKNVFWLPWNLQNCNQPWKKQGTCQPAHRSATVQNLGN